MSGDTHDRLRFPERALSFDELRAANLARCNSGVFGHNVDSWDLPRWANAMAGEAGETCNIVKKIDRGDFGPLTAGLPWEPKAMAMLEEELADVAIYLDLLAARARIDLGAAIRKKFNLVSVKRGSAVRL